MDSSGKPLEYGKLYQVEHKETHKVVTLEPAPFPTPEYIRVIIEDTVRLNWTWNWTLACFPPHSWHWHDMAEILNDDE